MLDLLLRGGGAVDGRAGRQVELQRRDALILDRQEAGGQAHEHDHQQRQHGGIDRQEQPFAGDHAVDPLDIAFGEAREAIIEPYARVMDVLAEPAPRFLPSLMLLPGLEQGGGQRRRQGQRHEHRQHHRRDDGQRELSVDDACRSTEKGHRQEHRRQHQGDGDQRDLDFAHRLDRRVARTHPRILVHHALDILDHDDRVVDQQADRQHQAEQGQGVDREAGDREDAEGTEQHDRHRDRRDERRTPALQEHEHHDDDEDDRLHQGPHHVFDRQLDEQRRVLREGISVAGGKALRRLFDLGLDQFGGRECVGARRQADRDARPGMAIDAAQDAIGVGTKLDPRHVRQPHDRAVGLGLDHDVGELRRRRQARLRRDRCVQHLVRAARHRADLTRRDLGILCGDRGDHVVRQ